jgi:hypothetical protein
LLGIQNIYFDSIRVECIAFTSWGGKQCTSQINHGINRPFFRNPRLPQDSKHQLRIEPFPGPRGHSLIIKESGDLAAIQTIILKPQNAVDQGLMGRVKVDKGQCFGFNPNSNTKRSEEHTSELQSR